MLLKSLFEWWTCVCSCWDCSISWTSVAVVVCSSVRGPITLPAKAPRQNTRPLKLQPTGLSYGVLSSDRDKHSSKIHTHTNTWLTSCSSDDSSHWDGSWMGNVNFKPRLKGITRGSWWRGLCVSVLVWLRAPEGVYVLVSLVILPIKLSMVLLAANT